MRRRSTGRRFGWLWSLLLMALVMTAASDTTLAADAPSPPPSTDRLAVLQAFCAGGTEQVAAVGRIVEAGVSGAEADKAWAQRLITAFGSGGFACREAGEPLLLGGDAPINAATLKPEPSASAESPYVPSIVMKRKLAVVEAELGLFHANAEERLRAASQIDKFFSTLDTSVVAKALATEKDARVKVALTVAMAKRGLNSTQPAERIAAIEAVANAPSETSRTLLSNFLVDHKDTLDDASAQATRAAIRSIDQWLMAGRACSVLFSGVSYAGILLLTALGLSIVFGLLGVINLAHGEFIMIGAYATFVVERLMQTYFPSAFGAYIFLAIPVAFVVCGLCGMLLEYFVIRFLYRRPLETLLATWAISIALIKLVQLSFGSQNVEFITPVFLNGGTQVFPGFFITWNRIFAIVLAVVIFLATYGAIRHTRFGLLIRATTQRRDTARSLGMPAERIDRMAFGLGAGLAGLAGVVLTQITSVNPSMGTSFVVDAFMVVVLGGAGSLIGTAVSSLALGELNQIIEPFYGAVAAKVAILVLIVLIIQRRPQGLFALKTRT